MTAVGALALFCGLQWATLVSPGAGGTMVLATALGAVGALLLAWAGRRWVTAAVVVVLVPLGLLVAGASVREVLPDGWGALVSRIGDGLNALPSIHVPYAGADPAVRLALLAGGVALVVLALVAAAAQRSGRGVSLAALIVVYAVPATETSPGSPYLRGAVFAILVAAVLWGERLAAPGARAEAPLAVVLVGLGVVAGLALGPGLDARKPWINWDQLVNDIAKGETEHFAWDHTYGPFDWPRDGRVVLQIRAQHSAYWKAANLDGFDGRRWVAAGLRPDDGRGGADVAPRPSWEETIRVTLAGMRTDQLIGAGSTLSLDRVRLPASPVGSPGTWAVVGQLHRGDSYQARVYVPRPTPTELARAGTAYPDVMELYRSIRLPASGGDPARGTEMVFRPFGSDRQPVALGPSATVTEEGDRVLARSPYARTYALARRLRAGAATPYGYVRRVQTYLDSGRFRYDEQVPRHAVPLEGFLFSDLRGYCQQFSGAMALLLRMGGIPARVAAGFSPGTYDAARRDYVVRDVDAHSWVEAYFPRYGWVTFDPTPAIAPARSQVGLDPGPRGGGDPGSEALGGRVSDPKAGRASPTGSSPHASFPALPVVAVAVAAALLALVGVALARRIGRVRPRVPPELAELDRALRRTGWRPDARVTLRRLEGSFAGQPDAAGYMRALREGRYGYGTRPPTPDQRRGLRRALAADRTLSGWMRALWALPPIYRRRGGA
jgi:protein-glutamine gamma-glutamyltransferase